MITKRYIKDRFSMDTMPVPADEWHPTLNVKALKIHSNKSFAYLFQSLIPSNLSTNQSSQSSHICAKANKLLGWFIQSLNSFYRISKTSIRGKKTIEYFCVVNNSFSDTANLLKFYRKTDWRPSLKIEGHSYYFPSLTKSIKHII